MAVVDIVVNISAILLPLFLMGHCVGSYTKHVLKGMHINNINLPEDLISLQVKIYNCHMK